MTLALVAVGHLIAAATHAADDGRQLIAPASSHSAEADFRRLPELTASATLDDYIVYAALNNPSLEAAFNRWKAALFRVPQVKSLPDPRFNYGYFINEVETRVGPQKHRLGVSQVFPWFGKLKLRGEAAGQAAEVARQQYEAAKLRLFDEVKQAYFELYFLGRSIAVTNENLELLTYLEQVARSKYEAGTALYGDVIKAQVELDKLRDRLRTLEDVQQPATARLNAALNRPARAALPLPESLTPIPFDTDEPALTARLRDDNPELRAFEAATARDRTNIALAQKEFSPDIMAGVDTTITDPARLPGVADSGKDPIMVGLSINLPIWRGKYRAGVHEAERRLRATQLDQRDRENRLTTDLELALFKLKDSERKTALYRDALIPKADQNLRVIQRAFEAGETEFLSLIDAERVLLEFQLTYERARADREQSVSTLERLVGGNETTPTAPYEENQP